MRARFTSLLCGIWLLLCIICTWCAPLANANEDKVQVEDGTIDFDEPKVEDKRLLVADMEKKIQHMLDTTGNKEMVKETIQAIKEKVEQGTAKASAEDVRLVEEFLDRLEKMLEEYTAGGKLHDIQMESVGEHVEKMRYVLDTTGNKKVVERLIQTLREKEEQADVGDMDGRLAIRKFMEGLEELLEEYDEDKLHDIRTKFIQQLPIDEQEEDEILEESESEAEEVQHDDYNPMGLQTWNEDSIMQAIDGGRLLLVILIDPLQCEDVNGFIATEAFRAATMIDSTFNTLSETLDDDCYHLPKSVTKPLIGLMDNSELTEESGFIDVFGTVTHYPVLKFVRLIFTIEDDEGYDCGAANGDCGEGGVPNVQNWDFIGPREAADNIYESVLMYWYRLIVSDTISTFDMPSDDVRPPVFTFASEHEMINFLQSGHGERALRPVQKARRQHQSKLESEVYDFYMGQSGYGIGGVFQKYEVVDEGNDNDNGSKFTQEIDPYLLLVQCRTNFDYGEIDLSKGKASERMSEEQFALLKNQLQAVQDFDILAEEMIHRMDVAFVALNATAHNEDIIGHACDRLFESTNEAPLHGDVAFVRVQRYVTYSLEDEDEATANDHQDEKQNHNIWNNQRKRVISNVQTDWGNIRLASPQAIFIPSAIREPITEQQKEIHGKFANKDTSISLKYTQSNLVASTVVHTTPTVMWYDPERVAQLAFPWYRKIHAVLFVDIGLPHKEWRSNSVNDHPPWPSSLNHSTESATLLLRQQKAIQMFYDAALWHRVKRPADDMVFLIVPSSEVRILAAFGIDIWTPLDDALFGTVYDVNDDGQDDRSTPTNGYEYCNSPDTDESNNILPVMMITDSSGRSGMQSSRYYLCSKDILSNGDGAIKDFIDKFYDGKSKPFTRSESTPSSMSDTATTTSSQHRAHDTNIPNITRLTGNTFQSLVMDRNHEHTMLFIQSYSCGHCKRFSIFWNELSMLVQKMNWSSVITVMKIDVSKNDIPHDKINAWDLPAVYYFPAFEKDNPIEMKPKMGRSNPQHYYDEGLSWVTSGYDIVEWILSQNKIDLELLLQLDKSADKVVDNEIRI